MCNLKTFLCKGANKGEPKAFGYGDHDYTFIFLSTSNFCLILRPHNFESSLRRRRFCGMTPPFEVVGVISNPFYAWNGGISACAEHMQRILN